MILVFDSSELVAQAAAERFVVHAQKAIQNEGRFSVALSGGSTPRRMYELLATDPFSRRVEWSSVHIFFGDERAVPLDHSDSNYRMAHDALISRVQIPTENVHPINGEGDPQIIADHYERELKQFFPGALWPRFDLILLGLGGDGHTASLFPGTRALKEEHHWVVSNLVEVSGNYRITLTVPAINAASAVEFLVAGVNKSLTVKAVLEGPYEPSHLPAQLITPKAGSLTWLLDAEAASLLSQQGHGTRPGFIPNS